MSRILEANWCVLEDVNAYINRVVNWGYKGLSGHTVCSDTCLLYYPLNYSRK